MVYRTLLVATVAAILASFGASAPAPRQSRRGSPRLFPVTIKAANGRVTIPRRPTRIILALADGNRGTSSPSAPAAR